MCVSVHLFVCAYVCVCVCVWWVVIKWQFFLFSPRSMLAGVCVCVCLSVCLSVHVCVCDELLFHGSFFFLFFSPRNMLPGECVCACLTVCVCMCVCVCNELSYTRVFPFFHKLVTLCVYVCGWLFLCECTCMYMWVRVCACMSDCLCVCLCVCGRGLYACVRVFISRKCVCGLYIVTTPYTRKINRGARVVREDFLWCSPY